MCVWAYCHIDFVANGQKPWWSHFGSVRRSAPGKAEYHDINSSISWSSWWQGREAPAKSNGSDGEVGEAEEEVGSGEGGQQAVEHWSHLPDHHDDGDDHDVEDDDDDVGDVFKISLPPKKNCQRRGVANSTHYPNLGVESSKYHPNPRILEYACLSVFVCVTKRYMLWCKPLFDKACYGVNLG